MAKPPEEYSVYVDWQFELPAPEEKEKFLKAVRNSQAEFDSELPWHMKIYQKIIRSNLDKLIGADRVTIFYEYAVEDSSGEWTDHEESVLVENETGVSIGDILFSLHHRTNNRLKGQGIMAIEALEKRETGDEFPAYFVYFGS